MSSARKPVIVRKWTRDWHAGYAAAELASDDLTHGLPLLDRQGKLIYIAWDQIKWVCYVRELVAGDAGSANGATRDVNSNSHPERLLRRRFAGKPRIAGLWLRLTLGDSDELEGVAANDSSLVHGLGLLLTPPDTRSNTQRVFVPRSSIRELTVLGVINPASRNPSRAQSQPELFEEHL